LKPHIPSRTSFIIAFLASCLCGLSACGRNGSEGSEPLAAKPGEAWDTAWKALQADAAPPADLAEPGPPASRDGRVWFRFRPDSNVRRVFLAGNFNAWAQNDSGRVSNDRFAMKRSPDGVWVLSIPHDRDDFAYKFVVEDDQGRFHWLPDPSVGPGNAEGHSLVSLPRGHAEGAAAEAAPEPAHDILQPAMQKVWVKPGEQNLVQVETGRQPGPEARWRLSVADATGRVLHSADYPVQRGASSLPVPALENEGGYRVSVQLEEPGHETAEGWTVLTVARSIADDLRYGFFATYGRRGGDYAARAAILAGLQINAVEFYDYFPAHGRYAPTEPTYVFEPFGIAIDALDVRDKTEACREGAILPLAYVAAYAASESVFREFPFPMTNADGVPLVFNGEIMPADRADRENKPKWFYLMNIAPDSPWYKHVMAEFRSALDDSPKDLLSFDGF
jgi:hypothetical protein